MPQSIQVTTIDGTDKTIRFNKSQLARLAYRPQQSKLTLYLLEGSVYYIQGAEALHWYEKLIGSTQQ